MATLPVDPIRLRARLVQFVERPRFEAFIVAVIVVNAISLGLETVPPVMAAIGPALVVVDKIALAIFVVELGLKIAAYGGSFFRRGWNWFDLVIVGIAPIVLHVTRIELHGGCCPGCKKRFGDETSTILSARSLRRAPFRNAATVWPSRPP